MTIHDFDKQLARGEADEKFIDSCFVDNFDIQRVSRDEQRKGIDRVFINRQTGETKTVEYKTDHKTQYTHNVFIETVSVDTRGVDGWALTCQADLLFYYVPGSGEEMIYIIQPQVIREHLEDWKKRYPIRSALNDGYKTWGICVPQDEFERIAQDIWS